MENLNLPENTVRVLLTDNQMIALVAYRDKYALFDIEYGKIFQVAPINVPELLSTLRIPSIMPAHSAANGSADVTELEAVFVADGESVSYSIQDMYEMEILESACDEDNPWKLDAIKIHNCTYRKVVA